MKRKRSIREKCLKILWRFRRSLKDNEILERTIVQLRPRLLCNAISLGRGPNHHDDPHLTRHRIYVRPLSNLWHTEHVDSPTGCKPTPLETRSKPDFVRLITSRGKFSFTVMLPPPLLPFEHVIPPAWNSRFICFSSIIVEHFFVDLIFTFR